MDQRFIQRLLNHVSDTETDEISCSDCFELLSTGVDLELAGAASTPALAGLAQHLRQSGVCREEYETLRDFVRSETEAPASPADGESPAAS